MKRVIKDQKMKQRKVETEIEQKGTSKLIPKIKNPCLNWRINFSTFIVTTVTLLKVKLKQGTGTDCIYIGLLCHLLHFPRIGSSNYYYFISFKMVNTCCSCYYSYILIKMHLIQERAGVFFRIGSYWDCSTKTTILIRFGQMWCFWSDYP